MNAKATLRRTTAITGPVVLTVGTAMLGATLVSMARDAGPVDVARPSPTVTVTETVAVAPSLRSSRKPSVSVTEVAVSSGPRTAASGGDVSVEGRSGNTGSSGQPGSGGSSRAAPSPSASSTSCRSGGRLLYVRLPCVTVSVGGAR